MAPTEILISGCSYPSQVNQKTTWGKQTPLSSEMKTLPGQKSLRFKQTFTGNIVLTPFKQWVFQVDIFLHNSNSGKNYRIYSVPSLSSLFIFLLFLNAQAHSHDSNPAFLVWLSIPTSLQITTIAGSISLDDFLPSHHILIKLTVSSLVQLWSHQKAPSTFLYNKGLEVSFGW